MNRTIRKQDIVINSATIGWLIAAIACSVAIIGFLGNKTAYAWIVGINAFMLVAPVTYLPPYRRVTRMEQALGINFDTEMACRDVRKFSYKDDDWYIPSRTTIVHRRYVVSVEGTHKIQSEGFGSYWLTTCNCVDGKQMDVRSEAEGDFEKWLQGGVSAE